MANPSAAGSADNKQGHIITLEITSGEVYRGKLLEGARAPSTNPHFAHNR
jgi:hypothetical protein